MIFSSQRIATGSTTSRTTMLTLKGSPAFTTRTPKSGSSAVPKTNTSSSIALARDVGSEDTFATLPGKLCSMQSNSKDNFPDFVQIIFFILLSTTIDYDEADHYVFVGDFSGKITICKLVDGEGVKFINLLKGHNASIQCLHWDGTKGWLYSGSFDARIFVWYVPLYLKDSPGRLSFCAF